MGNGACCKKIDRVDTMQLDEDQKNNPDVLKRSSIKSSEHQIQMISDSDSDDDNFFYQQKQPSLGHFKDAIKSSQLSTIQQYSFKSLPSEQQFQNFVTFSAIPSQQILQQNVFQQFQDEMKQMAKEQIKNVKSSKKVQFAI